LKRQWNALAFPTDVDDGEVPASALASVAEPRFLQGVQEGLADTRANGSKLWVSAHRPKLDADGNDITGQQGAAGQFRIASYEFTTAENSWTVDATPEIVGVGASHMLALELAMTFGAEAVRSLLNIKVILDAIGGQVLVSPYVREETVVGLIFHWEHISKVGRGQEPDAKIDDPLPLVIRSGLDGTYPEPTIAEPVSEPASNGSA
jgi:hypothetical protein